ncbi:MAG: PilN domain-containing protein [Microgenomates group bacterium]
MKYKINLLPAKELSLKDKIVYFSLNYLRYIIVITQLVVIIVFFYRFQIDQKIIDLKEEIGQKKEIVKVVQPLLNEADVIVKKSKNIETVYKDQNKLKEMLAYLSFFPETITLTKMEILNNSDIKLTGMAANIQHLQLFKNQLEKEKRFKKVQLTSLKKVFNEYSFVLNLLNYE